MMCEIQYRRGEEQMKKKIMKIAKKFFVSGFFLPVFVFLIVIAMNMVDKSEIIEEGEVKIVTKANLMDAIDVSELATSEFIYNGIAEVYKDEKKEDVKYHIRYDAKVKAGIDIKDVSFDIDDEEMIIYVTLPEVTIFEDPSIDPHSLSYIPSEKDYDLSEVLKTCEADVLTEAEAATELKTSAEDNLKSIIEALLKPLAEAEGYQIMWNE